MPGALEQHGRSGVLRPSRVILGGVRGAITGTSERRVLIALLLATALLVCHGLFGASHALAGASHPGTMPAVQDQETAHHPPPEHAAAGHAATASATDGEHAPALHAGSEGDYFAVLLVLALIVILGFLFAAVLVPARRGISRRSWSHRRFGAGTLLPRGPTPPLLQVFLL